MAISDFYVAPVVLHSKEVKQCMEIAGPLRGVATCHMQPNCLCRQGG